MNLEGWKGGFLYIYHGGRWELEIFGEVNYWWDGCIILRGFNSCLALGFGFLELRRRGVSCTQNIKYQVLTYCQYRLVC